MFLFDWSSPVGPAFISILAQDRDWTETGPGSNIPAEDSWLTCAYLYEAEFILFIVPADDIMSIPVTLDSINWVDNGIYFI